MRNLVLTVAATLALAGCKGGKDATRQAEALLGERTHKFDLVCRMTKLTISNVDEAVPTESILYIFDLDRRVFCSGKLADGKKIECTNTTKIGDNGSNITENRIIIEKDEFNEVSVDRRTLAFMLTFTSDIVTTRGEGTCSKEPFSGIPE